MTWKDKAWEQTLRRTRGLGQGYTLFSAGWDACSVTLAAELRAAEEDLIRCRENLETWKDLSHQWEHRAEAAEAEVAALRAEVERLVRDMTTLNERILEDAGLSGRLLAAEAERDALAAKVAAVEALCGYKGAVSVASLRAALSGEDT